MITRELVESLALTWEEYELIVARLGREPGPVELGMFGGLWTEHCGYKNSKPLLKLLPSKGPQVVSGPGEENAGAVDIGDGQLAVFKVESHNHPSAIEPYQGAATGVGGIIRDIFTMGARPIASLDSLRFGPLTEPRNRYLFNGVVGGIAGYGNCIGIPTVGGEVFFDKSYSGNPLVNALCVGLMSRDQLVSGVATGEGNILLLVGADTGRDGIGGSSVLASQQLDEKTEERRPTVQVGNPFLEKCLIEACLELLSTNWVVGMQDLGASGLTSASVEVASKGGSGIEMELSRVPRREEGMTPYEVLLSESQERMLVIVRKGYERQVQEVFERWDLHSDVIGRVTSDGLVRVYDNGEKVVEVPARLFTDPPQYRRCGVEPGYLATTRKLDLSRVPDVAPLGALEPAGDGTLTANGVLLRLLAAPNIASKRLVYRQYDHMVQINTVIAPGEGDAALLRIKGTDRAIALAMDGNGRYAYLDPFAGGAIAVAEAARNVVCTGARPIALTNCLNFGNPEKLEVYYQLENAIHGMAAACEALETPVVSGNVSLYNETSGEPIYPTPVIGMLGVLDDVSKRVGMGFQSEGDVVFVLGGDTANLAGSEYLESVHGVVAGVPELSLDLERRVQACCLAAADDALLRSAHDVSDGGLAVALAECCIKGGHGLRGKVAYDDRLDAELFGEHQSRIIVSVNPSERDALQYLAREQNVPLTYLGEVAGGRLTLVDVIDVPLERLADAYEHGLERALTD